MVRRYIIITILIIIGGIFLSKSLAADNEVTITVNAEIPPQSPKLSAVILKFTDGNPDNNPWTNSTEVTTMDFGTLKYTLADGTNAGGWFSEAGFCVVLFISSFGKGYEIRSSCSGLRSEEAEIPKNSFVMIPVYSEDDKWMWPGGETKQGPMPKGAELGKACSAVGENKLIYKSEVPGSARIIQVYYSLPPYGKGGSKPFAEFSPIPLEQPPGRYSGVVTITVSIK